ncbi:MAG: crossover junction endodeoxyribonuclease RuvC [Prosthecobacter sp.]|uniref:crossover junction endodeoxyribonuclease RuvC n=1 Tax=Prosthecobacter sp. TaxID=1965333 RepID=UPI0025D32C4C|nr:crossover junction endodeoxyribonuclease RuvC [Prosthecobacter sp.]MCF7787462.1 crossover junction endodeoxyribonuclease RuvC [Prosthecobacter sp.]
MARIVRSSTAAAVTPAVERVLAIDPALRKTGWAVVESAGGVVRAIEWGVIQNKPALLPSGCLVAIRAGLNEVITRHAPTVCAIESTIFVQSYKTAIVLGTARGACLIAAAEHGLPIYEYAPREIKQAAVGRGAAQKDQVAFMVRAQLHLRETPEADAADALAAAITHFQNSAAARITEREARRV